MTDVRLRAAWHARFDEILRTLLPSDEPDSGRWDLHGKTTNDS